MKKFNINVSSFELENLISNISRKSFLIVLIALTAILISCSTPHEADSSATDTKNIYADYERAEQFLAVNTNPLVGDQILRQFWQENDQLVYQKSTTNGFRTIIANLIDGNKEMPFDDSKLITAMEKLTNKPTNVNGLLFRELTVDPESDYIQFTYEGNKYSFNTQTSVLHQIVEEYDNEYLSPDGLKAAFIRDFNLWIRNTRNNKLTQLTHDGIENYGYATNNAGWMRDPGPVLLWSPDSQKIATFRHDGRNVGEMYLVSTEIGHSELDAWKYPLPGDKSIFMIERLVIHLESSPRIVRLNMPPDPQRSSTADHIAGRGGQLIDVEWSAKGDVLAFVSSSRNHKSATLRIANPETGEVKTIHNETVATYYESGAINPNWRILHSRNEFIWFSEQDNWGHLYLHDLRTGKLKRQLTSGDWSVLELQQVDESTGMIYFTAANKEADDPYFHYLYELSLDSGEPKLLTPETAHHVIKWSKSGKYFVDSYSTPDTPPTAIIRDITGKIILPLETANISKLIDNGWVAPQSFTVKARDKTTNLYGLLYKPSNFDPSKSYPILNYIYPGPQAGSVGSRSFRSARRDKQAIAELGFIVVELDAMGTPGRSKSFHDAYYGNMGDNGLPDQVTAIQQLATKWPWMDLNRIGVWGHSGGGFASTGAILRYPDFYKVAVSSAGNHDNRNYEDDWGEKWQGLLESYPPNEKSDTEISTTNYDNQANQLLAKNLKGKLLLAHGLMDDNVPPSNTLLVVQALIEAEKNFDLLILPKAKHGFGNSRYFMKRRWDYFVKHLKEIEPPNDYRFGKNIK
tara:strand:+ start:21218 stop:23623 length:2406 start_codon:yes stop_codon:yes gene_type:complete